MIFAKQSTAIIVTVGPVLDADGVAVTGGVVGDFKISKNGGAPAALNGSATLTHRATGHYSLSLTTSDVDTVGSVEIIIDDTTNACPIKEIQVLEEAIYDALFAASANAFSGAAGSTTLTALATGSITAAVVATGAIDADAIADNAIDAGALAADCITAAKIATGAIDADAIADNAIDAGAIAANAITAAKIADGAIDAATFAADVDAEILSYVVDDATRIDASALNTAAVTSVPAILEDTGTTLQGELDGIQADTEDIQAKIGTPAGASVSVDIAAVKTDSAAIKAKTDNLPTDPADQSLIMDRIGAPVGASISADIAAVKAQTGAIETDTQDLQTQIGTAGDGLTDIPWNPAWDDPVAAAVWDAPIADHDDVGSTGEQLAAAGSAGDPWATALPGAYGAGSAGKIIGDNINTPLSGIKSKTDLIPASPASETTVAAVKAKTDQMVFTKANELDVNTKSINDATILGDGTPGDLFRV